MLILLISSTSLGTESITSENDFQLFPPTLQADLVLPPCNWNEENICTRTADQEKIILEIYLGYTLAMKHRQRIEKVLNFDSELIELNEQMYHLSLTMIDDQSAYSDHLLERIEDYEKELKQTKKKDILHNILWGTAGAGLGALVMSIIMVASR